jgi:hypothetical protein
MNMFKITNTGGLVKRFLNAFKDVEFQVLTAASHRLEQSAEASGGAIEVRSIGSAISDLHQTLRSFEKKVLPDGRVKIDKARRAPKLFHRSIFLSFAGIEIGSSGEVCVLSPPDPSDVAPLHVPGPSKSTTREG